MFPGYIFNVEWNYYEHREPYMNSTHGGEKNPSTVSTISSMGKIATLKFHRKMYYSLSH